MGTVIFDFDSTLIPEESLQEMLSRRVADDPAKVEAIAEVTRLGMEGEIGYRESMERRLAIAEPDLAGVTSHAAWLADQLTDGAEDLVRDLLAGGHQVWIVSGAFRETLLPTAARLGVPPERVLGVQPVWHDDGSFGGLDPEDWFADSKVTGVLAAQPGWPSPSVGVGDGATDLALLGAGLVDCFVGYTEHAERRAVAESGHTCVSSMSELRTLLDNVLSS